MGRMDADMLAVVDREGAMIVPVLTVAWPDGTRRYSSHPFVGPASLSTPVTIRDLLRAWGDVQESVSDEEFQLETASFNVTVSDDDDDILKRVAKRYDLVGRAAQLDLAAQGLAASKWLRLWTGILGDAPHELANERAFALMLRSDDLPLQSYFPAYQINRYDWPAAHADALNKWAPIIYGLHDSRSITNAGAVPLFYVKTDANPFRYLISRGYLRDVMRVYKDDSAVTNHTIVRGIVNGRAYTWIEFTTSQGTSSFTADVEGLDATGDATGALIQNAAEIGKHLLVNWIYNEPELILSGGTPAWRSDSDAPVTSSTWSAGATWLDSLVYSGDSASLYIGGESQVTGIQAINDLCRSALASVQFDNLGKLAFVYEDLTKAPTTFALKLDYPQDEAGRSFHPITKREQLFSRAIAPYAQLVSEGSNKKKGFEGSGPLQIECEEIANFDATETLDLPWGPHFA